MDHVVLLGDSIFDNGSYVAGGQPIVEQLRAWLPRGSRASLLARDGAIVSDVESQLLRLPADATHLFVSGGGNDAMMNIRIIDDTQTSLSDGLCNVEAIQKTFRHDYRRMLQLVIAMGKPTTVCTIYDATPQLPEGALAALSFFNDVILYEAIRAGVPVLDLRQICTDVRDYSELSPIEPSEAGGSKIVRAIRYIVTGHDFARRETVVYGDRAL
jgi:hypothetical protein